MQVHLVHLACWLIAIGVVSRELPPQVVVSLVGTLHIRGSWQLLPTVLLPDVLQLLLHVDIHGLIVHVRIPESLRGLISTLPAIF